MGDAVLAFFPGHSAASSCEAALRSASAIIRDLAGSQLHGLSVSVGIALHYGEVSYGNIGSGRRMDFTMIGPDVNMVSRIQSVSTELKLPLLMSERFVRRFFNEGCDHLGLRDHYNVGGTCRNDCVL